MLTDESKRKLIATAMFSLPIGLVMVTASMLGGPTEAQAESTLVSALATGLSDELPSFEAALDEGQEKAAVHVAALVEQPFGATPLYHERGTSDVETTMIIDPGPGMAPTFTVSAILASKKGNTALIGGKAYRVGDTFGRGPWRVMRIDAVERIVVLVDPETGRTATGKVK